MMYIFLTLIPRSAEQIYRYFEPKTTKRIYLSNDCQENGFVDDQNQVCSDIFVLSWDPDQDSCDLSTPVTSTFHESCAVTNGKTCISDDEAPGKIFCGVKSDLGE